MKRSLYVAFGIGLALAAPVRSFAQSADLPDIDAALMSVASPGVVAAGSGAVTALGTETPEPPEVEGIEGPEDPNDTGPNVDHQFEGEETGENGDGVEPPGGGPGQ
jgi:hypothetical protein